MKCEGKISFLNSFTQTITSFIHSGDHCTFCTDLLVVLFEEDQLLFETFYLHLQVWSGQSQLIQEFLQTGDICLHWLTHGQLILIPGVRKTSDTLFRQYICIFSGFCISLFFFCFKWDMYNLDTHLVLKSSAANFALSIDRYIPPLARVASWICGTKYFVKHLQPTLGYEFKKN